MLWGKSLIAEFDVMDSNHVNATKHPLHYSRRKLWAGGPMHTASLLALKIIGSFG